MRAPATIGMPLDEVDTPALVLELDAFERNLRRMNEAVAGRKIRVRTHAKTHKCPEIARRQVAAGAVGVCCQKGLGGRGAGRGRHRGRAHLERDRRRIEACAASSAGHARANRHMCR
jgi:hypothetical protein